MQLATAILRFSKSSSITFMECYICLDWLYGSSIMVTAAFCDYL
jgi:hypothetical protein